MRLREFWAWTVLLVFALALEASGESAPPDVIELRVNEFGAYRYIRVESTGEVEFVRHGWYDIKQFRKGKLPPKDARQIFGQLEQLAFWKLKPDYAPPGGTGPRIDPSEGRLEMRQGKRKHLVRYSLADSPANLQRIHQYLLSRSLEFPDNAKAGDYLRTYELTDRSLLRPEHKIHKLSQQELGKQPALVSSIQQPGRLIWAGPLGKAAVRAWSDVEPSGFFLELKGRIYRVLILKHPSKGA